MMENIIDECSNPVPGYVTNHPDIGRQEKYEKYPPVVVEEPENVNSQEEHCEFLELKCDFHIIQFYKVQAGRARHHFQKQPSADSEYKIRLQFLKAHK